ncbi:MAG TPA: LLM class F420-dependent oxidoreductase [Thermomicrobiales bacterium]|nr:LLM class F420-dependent oxidoreductase [Thermomicrobiales bacterium]
MRLGLGVSNFTWPHWEVPIGAGFGQIAQWADDAGFASLWLMDHFFQIPIIGPPEMEMLEGWSALAFAAGRTRRIRLGTAVTGVTYRHPGILVKMATTLDVLSGGRTYFGIGAAWNEAEHRGLGVPFPPLAERFERLEETLQIARQMWAGDERPYVGKHYHLTRPLNSPQPVQRHGPPILIGGGGERKTLRLVAHYGDACNLFGNLGEEGLRRKLDILREHCRVVGRPYEAIEKTVSDFVAVTRDGRDGTLTPAAAVEHFAGLAALGIDHAILGLPDVTNPAVFDLFATEVIPQVAALPVAGR